MASGLETLGSLDQALQQARREMQELDQQIQATSAQVVAMQQERAKRYRQLAKVRLDQLTSGPVLDRLDDADRRAQELLAQRGQALQVLQRELEACLRRQTELEAERAAQQERVRVASETLDRGAAVTQKRLAQQPAYQQQLAQARLADSIAKHAEEKTQQSESDRLAKGQPYEADRLFSYLWQRGYGTARYSANPLTRLLDGWVARLCRYHDARPNYTMLLEIPRRLREHAEGLRAEAARQFAALQALEEAAAAEDGVPTLRQALQHEQQQADQIDAKIREQEQRYHDLMEQRSQFAAGEDPFFQEAIQTLSDQMRREPIGQLRHEAEATPTAEDNLVVQQLAELEDQESSLEAALAQHKQMHARHLSRIDELERVRRDFKLQRYDDIHSSFPNGALVTAMLNEFLRGMASSGQLWSTIEQQQRRRPIEFDPGFGSGGLSRPAGGGRHAPSSSGGRAGAGHTRGGGGFRTGGGF